MKIQDVFRNEQLMQDINRVYENLLPGHCQLCNLNGSLQEMCSSHLIVGYGHNVIADANMLRDYSEQNLMLVIRKPTNPHDVKGEENGQGWYGFENSFGVTILSKPASQENAGK